MFMQSVSLLLLRIVSVLLFFLSFGCKFFERVWRTVRFTQLSIVTMIKATSEQFAQGNSSKLRVRRTLCAAGDSIFSTYFACLCQLSLALPLSLTLSRSSTLHFVLRAKSIDRCGISIALFINDILLYCE